MCWHGKLACLPTLINAGFNHPWVSLHAPRERRARMLRSCGAHMAHTHRAVQPIGRIYHAAEVSMSSE